MRGRYHGVHALTELLHAGGGIAQLVTLGDAVDTPASVPLQPGDLVWLESPLNPRCTLVPIAAWVAHAHAHGAKVTGVGPGP